MIEGMRERHREKSLYILLTDTGTMFTTMIKRFTAAPYNHASLVFGADLSEIYSFGRKKPTNPFAGGFVEEDVYAGTFRHFPNTRCALLRLRVSEPAFERVRRVVDAFKRQPERYSYNLIGLLGVLLDREMGADDAYFCSEFVAEALRQAGGSPLGAALGARIARSFQNARRFGDRVRRTSVRIPAARPRTAWRHRRVGRATVERAVSAGGGRTSSPQRRIHRSVRRISQDAEAKKDCRTRGRRRRMGFVEVRFRALVAVKKTRLDRLRCDPKAPFFYLSESIKFGVECCPPGGDKC
ncbi:hypothetical protein [Cohnella rhizosphaerae]|uniref:hypothetical protein n=1 Tax=Cohnella rhizosphaerae TaxID=1457232 RepID=UPI0030B872CF